MNKLDKLTEKIFTKLFATRKRRGMGETDVSYFKKPIIFKIVRGEFSGYYGRGFLVLEPEGYTIKIHRPKGFRPPIWEWLKYSSNRQDPRAEAVPLTYKELLDLGQTLKRVKPTELFLQEMPMTAVLNLDNYNEQIYSLSPREAVIAAYAQSRGDNNTWDYEKRYGKMVKKHGRTWILGEYTAVDKKG